MNINKRKLQILRAKIKETRAKVKAIKAKYKDVPKEKYTLLERIRGLKHIYAGLKGVFREIFLILYAKIFGYYKSVDKLPIYNWIQSLKGDYKYLYKRRIKSTPRFFERWHMQLFFQLEKVDMGYFNDLLKLKYLQSLYVTTKNIKYYNMANFHKAAMDDKKKKRNQLKSKSESLNDMVTLIEETMQGIGQIDVYKISTSRFYSLYYRAIEKRKEINRHGNNKESRHSRKQYSRRFK